MHNETNNGEENIDPNNPTSNKELKRIQQEIGSVMRQISATVSYLPLLDCICSFDILIHTIKDCELPEKWNETDAVSIQNSQTVKLRSFSTGLHQVGIKLRKSAIKSFVIKNVSEKRLNLKMEVLGPGFQIASTDANKESIILHGNECRTIYINFCPTVIGKAIGK